MRISDWSSDVCSSDLQNTVSFGCAASASMSGTLAVVPSHSHGQTLLRCSAILHDSGSAMTAPIRSEEHTSELQSLMRRSYAVFCLKKKQQYISSNHL